MNKILYGEILMPGNEEEQADQEKKIEAGFWQTVKKAASLAWDGTRQTVQARRRNAQGFVNWVELCLQPNTGAFYHQVGCASMGRQEIRVWKFAEGQIEELQPWNYLADE